MARSDRRGVTAAQCSGIAARCCQHKAITAEQALADIADTVRKAGYKPSTADAVEVLTRAAMLYATVEVDTPEWYHPAAFALLVRAGAGEAEARRRRLVLDRRPKSFG